MQGMKRVGVALFFPRKNRIKTGIQREKTHGEEKSKKRMVLEKRVFWGGMALIAQKNSEA